MKFLPRKAALAGWEGVGIGLAIGVLLAALAVLFFTQTPPGRGIVLDWTVGAIQGTIDGTLEVGRARGNLLRGATVHGVEIRDRDGELFFRADSAEVAYGTRSILRGRMYFRRLVLHDATVELIRMPGDDLWNFQRIFPAPEPDVVRDPTATLVDLLDLHGADVRIRVPWEPDPEYPPERREEAIRDALDPEGRSIIERVPGGFLQTTAVRQASGRFLDIQVAGDELGGTFAAVEHFEGLVHVWREPIVIHSLRGELGIHDDKLEFRSPLVRLPDSEISGYGLIEFGDEGGVQVTLSSDDVALRDLHWLYPLLPEEGGGRLALHIESRPEGVLYLARDIDLTAPGTRVVGRVGVLVGERVEIVEPDLAAEPLRVTTIEAMLPIDLPFEDLRIRRARVEVDDGDGA